MSEGTNPDLNRLREQWARSNDSVAGAAPTQASRSPSSIATPRSPGGPPPSSSIASLPFIALLAASSYCLVVRYVPEIVFAPFLAWVYDQIRLIAWVPGEWGFVNVLMLLALLASGVIAARRVAGDPIWVPVAIVAFALVFSAISALTDDGMKHTGFGIAAAAIIFVFTVKIGFALSLADGVEGPPKLPVGTLGIYVVGFLPALALGRWIYADPLTALAQGWSGNFWTLDNTSTLWCWIAGALIAALVALLASLIPVSAANARTQKCIAIVLILVALLVYVGPEAKASAYKAVNDLTTSSPTDRLSDFCSWWKQGTAIPTTTVFRGSGCATVDVYKGSRRIISRKLPFVLSAGANFGPSDRSIDPYRMVGGPYNDYLAMGAIQGEQAGVVYINRLTGNATTADLCPVGTQSVELRFAGSTTTSEERRNLQITYPGDGQAVYLTCDGAVRRIPM